MAIDTRNDEKLDGKGLLWIDSVKLDARPVVFVHIDTKQQHTFFFGSPSEN